MTPAGLQALRAEHEALLAQREALPALQAGAPGLARTQAQLLELETRIASAVVVVPTDADRVRFGTFVVVENAAGDQKRYHIVGVDEAEASLGRISFLSPLARALLGHKPGDAVTFMTPHGEEELQILAITTSL